MVRNDAVPDLIARMPGSWQFRAGLSVLSRIILIRDNPISDPITLSTAGYGITISGFKSVPGRQYSEGPD
jgi:hypothetical protein